jgi:predicted amidohydrolase YtcJ
MPLGRQPVLLLLHGTIHTMEADHPRATALAVDRGSGRILAIGDDDEIRTLAGPLTETLDLRGRTVLPGFIDAHAHLLGYAQSRLGINLRDAHSEEEASARVHKRAERTTPGTWVFGLGWDKNVWREQRFPTRASLDSAAPDRPVALSSHDTHSLWVNSEALRRAGITRDTPDPAGGRIERDADGEATGMLFENSAMALVEAVAKPADDEALCAELRRALAELCARGITGVHNIENAHSLHVLQRLRAERTLAPRILVYLQRQTLPDALRMGLQADFGDDALRFAGIKVFMDGALGSQTAAMLDPYEGQPTNRGLLATSEPEVERIVREAAGGSVGIAIHAIGDRAVHAALDGIEAALRDDVPAAGLPPSSAGVALQRFRLEHVQLATPDDVQRMARLGVVASVQPFHAVVDRFAAERHWGARHRRAYAYQTLREAGVRLALGSDVPVDTADPLRILHAAINRQNDQAPDLEPWLPDQALSVAQALWAYTVGAALAGGQESRQGSLAPGKLADMVVLEEDPFRLPRERIAGAEVAATLVGGELVHGTLE